MITGLRLRSLVLEGSIMFEIYLRYVLLDSHLLFGSLANNSYWNASRFGRATTSSGHVKASRLASTLFLDGKLRRSKKLVSKS